MKDSIKQIYYPGFAGLAAILLTAIILLTVFSASLRNAQNNVAEGVFANFDVVAIELRDTLESLNQTGFTECSEANLAAMRQALFESRFSKQIAFYTGNTGICTSGIGLLPNSFTQPDSDFSTPGGVEVWVNTEVAFEPSAPRFLAIVAKVGNYSTMFEPAILALSEYLPYRWEFFYLDTENSDNYTHILGSEGIYRVLNTDTNSIFYAQSCSEFLPYYCLALETTWSEIINNFKLVLSLMVLICLASGFIARSFVRSRMLMRTQVPARIKNGLTNGAFYWLYQPIMDLKTDKIIGCEALARFSDKFGEIKPAKFIEVVRDEELTTEFTSLMIETVMPELEQVECLPDKFEINLNIFPTDIISGEINELISKPEISNSRFQISIEITEDEKLDESIAQSNLNKVSESGINIALDDFGTGYSNLKNLQKINCNYLKIDRSYIRNIGNESLRSSLIPNIVGMAKQMGLQVVAEGIETLSQKNWLVNLGVEFGQGHFIGKPTSSGKITKVSAHVVTYDTESAYIFIKYHGSITMTDIEDVRREAVALTRKHQCHRMLTDFRDGTFDLSTMDIYELPESTSKAYSESGLTVATVKRALVIDYSTGALSFLETLSQNQGQDVKIFNDMESAKAWLQEE